MHGRLMFTCLLLLLAGCALHPPQYAGLSWEPVTEEEIVGARTYLVEPDPNAVWAGIPLSARQLRDAVVLTLNKRASEAATQRALRNDQPLLLTPVLSNDAGSSYTVTTGWVPIAGRTTGILWWSRRWPAEVKHTVLVTPSVSHPNTHSTFAMISQVRERPNEHYPWSTGDATLADASFTSLRSILILELRKILASKNVPVKL